MRRFCGLRRQFPLYPMSRGGGFGEVQLVLCVPLHRFADGANVITQVAVLLQAVPHDDRRRLYGDEPFFYQPRHIAFDGTLAFADGFTDSFVAGPTLVGAWILQPHQYSVGGQLAGT